MIAMRVLRPGGRCRIAAGKDHSRHEQQPALEEDAQPYGCGRHVRTPAAQRKNLHKGTIVHSSRAPTRRRAAVFSGVSTCVLLARGVLLKLACDRVTSPVLGSISIVDRPGQQAQKE